jgi:uncharacterized FlgJ-related protein
MQMNFLPSTWIRTNAPRLHYAISVSVIALWGAVLPSSDDDAALPNQGTLCVMEDLQPASAVVLSDGRLKPSESSQPRKEDTPEQRKAAFLSLVLPMISQANQRIERERRLVTQAYACLRRGLYIDMYAQTRLEELEMAYGAVGDPDGLLRRLDIVPPSLALAQSAVESGWGTAKIAVDANALFGQMVPGQKPAAKHGKPVAARLASFNDLEASVAAYLHNLNTHAAYREFRVKREEMRQDGQPILGLALADTLRDYSERGRAYIGQIKKVITQNGLDAYDVVPTSQATQIAAGNDQGWQ